MTAVVEFKQLSKMYKFGFWGKKQLALDNLAMSVPQNSIFGFLGANGAGKTTTIKILMGLQFPTSGDIAVFGGSYTDAEVRARIGYLPERPYFQDLLTATEFLNFHRNLYGAHKRGKRTNDELLALVGLKDVKGKLLKDFSKGMLQRIGIAQALVNEPDLVVLDEPMSGLDPEGRKDVRNLILQLKREGKTVFFSSHIISDIESICDEIGFLEKGVLKRAGKISDILNTGAHGKEIVFGGISRKPEGPALAGAAAVGERYILKCENAAQARQAIEEVWRLGGEIHQYQSQHITLEEMLFSQKGGA